MAILPCAQASGCKSCILLADGTKLYSPIASTTLKRRLEVFALEKPRIRNRSKRQRNSISP